MAGRQGYNLRGDSKDRFRGVGPQRPQWKGDAAQDITKRQRTRRLYSPDKCQHCGKKAIDLHHIDGDPGNNSPENVVGLCRRCHMKIDGRLKKFIAYRDRHVERLKAAIKTCSHCKREIKPLRRGLCHACNEYQRRTGKPRPAHLFHRQGQRCHLRHDAPHHAATARRTRAKKAGQIEMSI